MHSHQNIYSHSLANHLSQSFNTPPPTVARTQRVIHLCSCHPITPCTPLIDALFKRGQQARDVPLHVPGHKRGKGLHPKFQELLDFGLLKFDLTEVSGLDYLSSPTGVIGEAQSLAAATFSADRTWFLVNGCSAGVHAAVAAVAGPGDTLLVARNCHQSACAAMTIAGCQPWWVQPEVDAQLGIAHGITPTALRDALTAATEAGCRIVGVLVVSPTYYGAALPISELASICHDHGVPLLVDEAHGGHFGLHPAFPPSALQQGADLSVQSTHKVLSAMTQAAMLHIRGTRVDQARVSRALQMLQSSSPSYLLMASLDAARALADVSEACFGEALRAAQNVREGLSKVQGITTLGNPLLGTSADIDTSSSPPLGCPGSISAHDPLRFTVCVTGLGMSGFQAAEMLERDYHIVPEMATQSVVVFIMGPGTQESDGHALVSALHSLSMAFRAVGWQKCEHPPSPAPALQRAPNVQALTPREAFFAQSVRLPVAEAVGRVSVELLCPYPPGVPVLFPGEVITADAVQVLQDTLDKGGYVTGATDCNLETLLVVA